MLGLTSGWEKKNESPCCCLRTVSCIFLTAAVHQVCKATATLNEVQNFTTTGNVASAIYSSQYNLLLLRDSGTDIRVLNASTGTQLSIRTPSATGSFTDFALSPSGRYLYAADYGGTNIGYDTPLYPSYVDRYDLQTNTWTSAQAPAIGHRIAPVDDSHVLLLGVDQWVDLTDNTYAPGAMSQLSKISPGYSGNIEYNATLGKIFYNETGLSSENINTYTLSGSTMTSSQTIAGASYGNYLGLLSSDGNAFYYGQEAVKASDITKTIATFSETISAAGPAMAFGSAHYYDASTGAALGALAYSPITWTVGANGKDAWAIQQPSGGRPAPPLRHRPIFRVERHHRRQLGRHHQMDPQWHPRRYGQHRRSQPGHPHRRRHRHPRRQPHRRSPPLR